MSAQTLFGFKKNNAVVSRGSHARDVSVPITAICGAAVAVSNGMKFSVAQLAHYLCQRKTQSDVFIKIYFMIQTAARRVMITC